jgi:hypothetical protein
VYIVSDEQFNAKFWSRIVHEGECWLWTGPTINTGYGTVSRYRRHILAHRFAYELTHGPIPDGMKVCHNCPDGDNPRCVNPAHLFLGTQKDNVDDMRRKGREGWRKNKPQGSAHGRAKIVEDDVREIRRLVGAGESRPALAAHFGVSLAAIDQIVNRKTWKHVA